MKRLLVMRHAKSSWDEAGVSDHDRSLNKRGLRAAPAMGNWLCEHGIIPQLVVTSSAKRARMTTDLVVDRLEEASGSHIKVQVDTQLYLGTPKAWLSQVPAYCAAEDCVMIVGHNPGYENLIFELTGQVADMPTAAIAVIDIPIDDWSQMITPPRAELVHVWRPKEVGIQ